VKSSRAQTDTVFDKYEAKKEAFEENLETKNPKLFGYYSKLKDVWAETFPDPDKKMAERMKARKKAAKQQRELEEKQEKMTPEEIEEMEKSIPEWKRNALVMTGEEVKEEKKGVFSKIKGKLSSTEAAKNFQQSEEYEKLKEARSDFRDTMDKFKEGIENT
jgi:hypothetical protein